MCERSEQVNIPEMVVPPKIVEGNPEFIVVGFDVWSPADGEMIDPGAVSNMKIEGAHRPADDEVLPYR